jgi:hypothetical protein
MPQAQSWGLCLGGTVKFGKVNSSGPSNSVGQFWSAVEATPLWILSGHPSKAALPPPHSKNEAQAPSLAARFSWFTLQADATTERHLGGRYTPGPSMSDDHITRECNPDESNHE